MVEKICVFCGSSIGNNKSYAAAAEALGSEIARKDMELVYGGGNVGLMGAIADRVLEKGGKVTGVMPQHLADYEIAHQHITELKIVKTMMERKKMLMEMSDAFIALPGGFGTLDEISEVITWNQLKIMSKPMGFLNVKGFYDHLLKFIERATDDALIRQEHIDKVIFEEEPARILDCLKTFEGFTMDKWIDDIKSEKR
ncbi:MAG: TIGR00730 family Rossman fold protein [Bacteroidales bacterium]|nr:TIGR00730 family Rossman fold protein [Bacteroidales bacterium]MCF8332586.1 TIGR00730 family Rossman fold protein [Bacteroidales bacterium]